MGVVRFGGLPGVEKLVRLSGLKIRGPARGMGVRLPPPGHDSINGRVVNLADTLDLGSSARKGGQVQPLSRPPW